MNEVCKLLGIKYPIVQGAMQEVATAELAAAVSNGGGLGIIAAGGKTADQVREEIQKAKKLTKNTFAVNLMLMDPNTPEVVKVVIDEGVKVVTTGAGTPKPYMKDLKAAGIKVCPVIPNVKIAKKMEEMGADAVIAEGMEGGGHIGVLTSQTLWPQIADAVSIPLIAAGGIGDGRGVAAAFMLGAAGAQMGTRFLTATESEVHPNFKSKILKAKDIDTIVTGNLLGNRARVLKNKMAKSFVKNEVNELQKEKPDAAAIEKLESGTLRRAVQEGDKEGGAFMAGQISGLIKDEKPAADILSDIWAQATDLMGIENTTL